MSLPQRQTPLVNRQVTFAPGAQQLGGVQQPQQQAGVQLGLQQQGPQLGAAGLGFPQLGLQQRPQLGAAYGTGVGAGGLALRGNAGQLPMGGAYGQQRPLVGGYGQQNPLLAQQQQAQQLGPTLDTLYQDLPQADQEWLASIHQNIARQDELVDKLTEVRERNASAVGQVQSRSTTLLDEMNALLQRLENTAVSFERFRSEVSGELLHGETAWRTIERLRAPDASQSFSMNSLSSDQTSPSHYFLILVDQFEERMHEYACAIDDIDRFLQSSASLAFQTYSPDQVQGVMYEQHDLFMAIADQVASAHNQFQELKEQFLANRKLAYAASAEPPNPFEEEARKQKKKLSAAEEQTRAQTQESRKEQEAQYAQQHGGVQSQLFNQSTLGSPGLQQLGQQQVGVGVGGAGAGALRSPLGTGALGLGRGVGSPALQSPLGVGRGALSPAGVQLGAGQQQRPALQLGGQQQLGAGRGIQLGGAPQLGAGGGIQLGGQPAGAGLQLGRRV